MRYHFLLILIFTLLTSTGCKENELDAKIKALVEQTKKNMVFVQGGSFMMGDPGTEVTDEYGNTQRLPITMWTNDDYVHKVTLDSYYINKFETTYGEFDLFCKATGREIFNKDFIDNEWRCEACPTAVPNWQAAKDYCKWLSEITGQPFDLPTEAQWEYAARSRGKKVFYATDNGQLDHGRNFEPKKGDEIHTVGTYPPNPLGLYDFSGNVSEWTNDWFNENYYKISPNNNPKGPSSGTKKTIRGGSVSESPSGSLVYNRYGLKPTTDGGRLLGFRCVCNTKNKNTF